MSDAIAAPTPVSAPARGKGLMEQESPVENGESAQDFAAMVEAWAPDTALAAAAIDGAVLPTVDETLPPAAEGELPDALEGELGLAEGPTSFSPLGLAPSATPTMAPGAARGGFARDGLGALRDAAGQRRQPVGDRREGGAAVEAGAPAVSAYGTDGKDFLSALVARETATDALASVAEETAAAAVAEAAPSTDTPPAALAAAGHGGRGDTGRLTLDSQLPVLAPQFAERFSEQVSVLVNHGVKSALLSLNPAELGPVEVRISLVNNEAHVQIASAHGVVRDVINEALPRLREMFESSGMRLGDSGVFSELPQQQQPQAEPGFLPRTLAADWQTPVEETVLLPRRALSLVDAYA